MKRTFQNRSRPVIRRMAHLRKWLLNGRPFNASSVARELEVDIKTVHRDIEFMRDNLGYDFHFDRSLKTYHGAVPAQAIL